MEVKVNDRVWILPAITTLDSKVQATVIEIEDNAFNGKVISAKTDQGVIYFGQAIFFDPIV